MQNDCETAVNVVHITNNMVEQKKYANKQKLETTHGKGILSNKRKYEKYKRQSILQKDIGEVAKGINDNGCRRHQKLFYKLLKNIQSKKTMKARTIKNAVGNILNDDIYDYAKLEIISSRVIVPKKRR